MSDIRVQEYTLDQGVFRRSSVYEVPISLYYFSKANSRGRRRVILPENDPYGSQLPETVRSWDEMNRIVAEEERKWKTDQV